MSRISLTRGFVVGKDVARILMLSSMLAKGGKEVLVPARD